MCVLNNLLSPFLSRFNEMNTRLPSMGQVSKFLTFTLFTLSGKVLVIYIVILIIGTNIKMLTLILFTTSVKTAYSYCDTLYIGANNN